jgi:hypothetical protein
MQIHPYASYFSVPFSKEKLYTRTCAYTCAYTHIRVSQYYMPYFVGRFLDIKINTKIHINIYPEGPSWKVRTFLISSSMFTRLIFPTINGLYRKRKNINNLLIFTFVQAMLEMAACSRTHSSALRGKETPQVLEGSACTCILYFACRFLNSTPQFLCSIDCADIDLISKFPPKREI